MNKIFKIIRGGITYLFRDKTVKTSIDDYWKTLYPVGSCYFSTNSASPATLFGGTWEALSGYVKIVPSTTAYGTGGSSTTSTVTLAASQLPSHYHSYTTQNTGAHTHTTNNTGAHTHSSNSIGAHTHSLVTYSHTHLIANTGHYHTSNSVGHTHTSEANGAHSHTAIQINAHTHIAQSSGGHTHTNTSTGAHTHQTTAAGAHTHTAKMSQYTGYSVNPYQAGMQRTQESYAWRVWVNGETTYQGGTYGAFSEANGGAHTHAGSSIAAHNHTSACSSTGAHTHTSSNSTGDHTHTTSNFGNHTHTSSKVGDHNHNLTTKAGAHTHALTTTGEHTHTLISGGDHTHTTGKNGGHTHTTSSVGNHTHSANTSASGAASPTGHNHTIAPTYIQLYAWRRTA